MAFFDKGVQLGAEKEEGSRYDEDTLQGGGEDQERKGAVAVRTRRIDGGGKERSGLDGGTGRVLWEDGSGVRERPADGVQEWEKTEGMTRKETFRLRSGLGRVGRKWRGHGRGAGASSGEMRHTPEG